MSVVDNFEVGRAEAEEDIYKFVQELRKFDLINEVNNEYNKIPLKADNYLIYNPISYPLDQVLMMNFLASRQGTIIHAAGWAVNNRGLIFAGKFGAGKTTISSLIHRGGKGAMLSDDRVAVRKVDEKFKMYGTPWPGEGGFAENRLAPLNGLFFSTRPDIIKLLKSARPKPSFSYCRLFQSLGMIKKE